MKRPQERRSGLPEFYTERVEASLRKRGYSLNKPKDLAEAVKKLSDFYLENPTAATPWDDVWAQVASLVYFFPLNYARAALVARETERLGFLNGITAVVDDGAGMGSGIHALRDHVGGKERQISKWLARDVAPEALDLLNELSGSEKFKIENVRGTNRGDDSPSENSLLMASYVFTELYALPKEWLRYEAIILIEPSTREDARRLQTQRPLLQAEGFELWAPCPHQEDCPLLVHSEKDWCHDRLHFDPPAWFTEIERLLPMKNKTLSFSYLAARKKKAPIRAADGFARLVGDTLEEKGKWRQAVCRSPAKEYLAWFPQRLPKGESIALERGSLIQLRTENLEIKSTEVRVKSTGDIRELGTDEVVS